MGCDSASVVQLLYEENGWIVFTYDTGFRHKGSPI